MKFGEVMKQFKLNIRTLLLSEIYAVKENNYRFTFCVQKPHLPTSQPTNQPTKQKTTATTTKQATNKQTHTHFTICMHSDIYLPNWKKVGAVVYATKFYILILAHMTLIFIQGHSDARNQHLCHFF